MNRVSAAILLILVTVAAVEFGLLGASAAGLTGGNRGGLPPVGERLGVPPSPTPSGIEHCLSFEPGVCEALTATPTSPSYQTVTPTTQLSPPSSVSGITIIADPLAIQCDGSQTSHVRVRILDVNGNPAPEGVNVYFEAYNGNPEPYFAQTVDGYAETDVRFYGDIFPYGPNLIVRADLLQAGIRILCVPQSAECPLSPPAASPPCGPTPTPTPCPPTPTATNSPTATPTFEIVLASHISTCGEPPSPPGCPLSPPAVSPPCGPTATPVPCLLSPPSSPGCEPTPISPPDACPPSPPNVSPPCEPTPPSCDDLPASPPCVPTPVSPPPAFDLVFDCDLVAPGEQHFCTTAPGTTVDTEIVFRNNSGTAIQLGTFNFVAVNKASALLSPLPGNDQNLNGNPDFNQAAVTGDGWACAPPPPMPDLVPGNSETWSFISCFNGSGTGPLVEQGASLSLATIHYSVPPDAPEGYALLSFTDAMVASSDFFELGSCYPVVARLLNCGIGAVEVIEVEGSPTPDAPAATLTTSPPVTATRPPSTGTTAVRTATVIATRTPQPNRCADVNGNGRVDLNDLKEIARSIVKHQYRAAYDINRDGRLSRTDLTAAVKQLGRRC